MDDDGWFVERAERSAKRCSERRRVSREGKEAYRGVDVDVQLTKRR